MIARLFLKILRIPAHQLMIEREGKKKVLKPQLAKQKGSLEAPRLLGESHMAESVFYPRKAVILFDSR